MLVHRSAETSSGSSGTGAARVCQLGVDPRAVQLYILGHRASSHDRKMMSTEHFASIGVLEVGTSGAAVVTSSARRRLRVGGYIGAALHGDEVRAVEIEPGRARVLEMLVRRARRLVGVVDGGGRWFLCDDDWFPRALVARELEALRLRACSP